MMVEVEVTVLQRAICRCKVKTSFSRGFEEIQCFRAEGDHVQNTRLFVGYSVLTVLLYICFALSIGSVLGSARTTH
jgi:hypothetical protein